MPPTSYVFVHSTGRSGTGYLARLFGGQHEPEPGFVANMRRFASEWDEAGASEWLARVKLPFIDERFSGVYLETSHLCWKGYLIPLVRMLGGRIKVVRLRRDEEKIRQSFKRIACIPGRDVHVLSGTDKMCVERVPVDEWEGMPPEDRIAWYVRETESQWTHRVLPVLAPGQWTEVNLEDIVSETQELSRLAEFIGLDPIPGQVGKVVNSRR